MPVNLLLSITSQITEPETDFFLSLSMVLIYNRGRRFGTQLCFHLQVKCEEAPNLVDPLELLFVTVPSLRVPSDWVFYITSPED